ncbi:MAG: hypothetical protein JW969_05260 [Spirochaetales bacterium]|nr:hypothetical protein [Spirochaetales bacterium]
MNPDVFLLADKSACLRYLVLKTFFNKPDSDPEVKKLKSLRRNDSIFYELTVNIFEKKDPPGKSRTVKKTGSSLYDTSIALARLGYLGFDKSEPEVQALAGRLFSRQEKDGTWKRDRDLTDKMENEEKTKGKKNSSLTISLPLRGLAACGYATDPRCEKAFDTLLGLQLEDGAWPVYTVNGVNGYIAGYRKMPQSRWGCRTNTTFALLCLSLHPERRKSSEVKKALDLLLGRETNDRYALGEETARMIGIEPARGFLTYFARFDLSVVLRLCARIGASLDDARVKKQVDFLNSLRSGHGFWQNDKYPHASHWLTYDLKKSLNRIEQNRDWMPLRPRTPFQAYPKVEKRF